MAKTLNQNWDNKSGAFGNICGGSPGYTKREVGYKRASVFADYHKYVAEGRALPFLPYEISNSITMDEKIPSPKYGGYAMTRSCFGSASMNVNRALNKASYEASRNFYKSVSKLSKANIAVSVLEAGESIKLIGDSAARLANAFIQLKRGNINGTFQSLGMASEKAIVKRGKYDSKKQRRIRYTERFNKKLRREYLIAKKAQKLNPDSVANFASQSWLELQFGWKPICQDIYDIADAASSLLTAAEGDFYTFFGSSEQELNYGDAQCSSLLEVQNADGFIVVKYGARFRVANSALFRNNTLGFTNPLSVAWELVPFSFVADWFIPVGDFLESLTGLQGLVLIESMTSIKTQSGLRVRNVSSQGDFPCASTYITSSFKRTTGVLLPWHHLPKVDLGDVMSIWTALTSISLLKQVFGK